jgi:hypothetical protein
MVSEKPALETNNQREEIDSQKDSILPKKRKVSPIDVKAAHRF